MKQIQLTQNKIALVDDSDYEILTQFKWCYSPTGYAVRGTRSRKEGWQKLIYMHRAVLETEANVDHINGDKLDNRRENLRVATQGQNLMNTAKRSDNISGYKGVSWDKEKRKWVAQIHYQGKHIHIGRYLTPIGASEAYRIKAKELFGEFARI